MLLTVRGAWGWIEVCKLPEYQWGDSGYIFVLAILVGSAVATFFILKKNKWL